MPVYPVTWEQLRAGGRYRHMFKHDIRIWERFIAAYGASFPEVAYDIALGGVIPGDERQEPELSKMWQYSTAKKIDAAIRNDAECWLCEVRPQAGLAAIGSVLGYALLSEHDPWTTLPLVMTIVTDMMDGDSKLVCSELDIQVIELPETTPPPIPAIVTDLGEPTPGAAPPS